MSKKKRKNARARAVYAPAPQLSAPPPVDWESVEADFFARESDLYRVNPVENFEDLDKDLHAKRSR